MLRPQLHAVVAFGRATPRSRGPVVINPIYGVFIARAPIARRKLIRLSLFIRASDAELGLRMALLDFERDRVGRHSQMLKGASDAGTQQRKWQRMALDFIGTVFVLMGIAIGVLTLRFALVLMHGVLH
jgi:hypothetical protein